MEFVVLVQRLAPKAAQWNVIGLLLGLTADELDIIEANSNGVEECLRKALQRLCNRSPRPTWEKVVAALRSPLVGDPALAERLEAEMVIPTNDQSGSVYVNQSPKLSQRKLKETVKPVKEKARSHWVGLCRVEVVYAVGIALFGVAVYIYLNPPAPTAGPLPSPGTPDSSPLPALPLPSRTPDSSSQHDGASSPPLEPATRSPPRDPAPPSTPRDPAPPRDPDPPLEPAPPSPPVPTEGGDESLACTEIGEAKHLDKVLGKIGGGLKPDEICDRLGVRSSACIHLENRGKLDSFHISQAYIAQRAQSCWEDIVQDLCFEFHLANLAKTVSEQRNIAFPKGC